MQKDNKIICFSVNLGLLLRITQKKINEWHFFPFSHLVIFFLFQLKINIAIFFVWHIDMYIIITDILIDSYTDTFITDILLNLELFTLIHWKEKCKFAKCSNIKQKRAECPTSFYLVFVVNNQPVFCHFVFSNKSKIVF